MKPMSQRPQSPSRRSQYSKLPERTGNVYENKGCQDSGCPTQERNPWSAAAEPAELPPSLPPRHASSSHKVRYASRSTKNCRNKPGMSMKTKDASIPQKMFPAPPERDHLSETELQVPKCDRRVGAALVAALRQPPGLPLRNRVGAMGKQIRVSRRKLLGSVGALAGFGI